MNEFDKKGILVLFFVALGIGAYSFNWIYANLDKISIFLVILALSCFLALLYRIIIKKKPYFP